MVLWAAQEYSEDVAMDRTQETLRSLKSASNVVSTRSAKPSRPLLNRICAKDPFGLRTS